MIAHLTNSGFDKVLLRRQLFVQEYCVALIKTKKRVPIHKEIIAHNDFMSCL